jgi:phage-related protein (TIGR01555 family)
MADGKQAGNRFRPGTSGNPKGRPRKQERRDGWINTATGHGTSRDRRLLTSYGLDVVTDLEAMNLWRSEFLAARIIEAVPNDAFRRGWEIRTEDKAKAEAVVARCEELGVDDAMTRAAEYERAYGGAAIFPVMQGALGDLAQPLNETGIASVDALHVLEPRELWPAEYYTDLAHPKFGMPKAYRLTPLMSGRGGYIQNQVIHESRLVIFPGQRVSRQTQPGQREGWGDSVLSRPHRVLADFGLAWGSAATLIHDFGQGVLKMKGLSDLQAQASIESRFAAIDMFRSTLRTLVIDADDDFARTTTSLAGLEGVLVQFMHLMAAAVDMPVTILMGTSPAGMNATGESDTRGWYDRVARIQSADYRPRLEQLLKQIMLSTSGPTGGKEPTVWSAEFRPLWAPSEKEQADTRLVIAQTDQVYVDMGAVSPDDIAESRWKGDTYSAEMVVDWAAREERRKQEEERRVVNAMLPRLPEIDEDGKPNEDQKGDV